VLLSDLLFLVVEQDNGVLLLLLSGVSGGSLHFGSLKLHGAEVGVKLLFRSVTNAHHLGDTTELGRVFHVDVLKIDVSPQQVSEFGRLLL